MSVVDPIFSNNYLLQPYSFPNNVERLNKANYRVRSYNREISKEDKIKALVGSTIGTVVPILFMMKKQKALT